MKNIFLFITALAMVFASCNREDSHIVLPENTEQSQGGVILRLNTDGVTNKKFNDTHLYGFDVNGKMTLHKYYATQKELSSDMFVMENGVYTFVAVLNVGKDFLSVSLGEAGAPVQNVLLNQLLSYVKRVGPDYSDMLTGMTNRAIVANKVERVEIPLFDKSGGITVTTTVVTTTVTLPDAGFAEYQKVRTRATSDYNLRGVVAFYQEGKTEPTHRASAVLVPTAINGKYTFSTEVFNAKYKMVLWVDYTTNGSNTDLWYDTQSLQAVKIISTDNVYTSGSDSREVFYGTANVEATTGSEVNVDINTERPQAKYRLIAEDITRYHELMVANPDKYVPLNELNIEMSYEGFLPDGFNVQSGKPNSSKQGYKCHKTALPTVGEADTEVQIGSDYVFVNGDESSVTVTVLVTDKTGHVVSRVQGVAVQYKRNMLTTVRGDFLTAGVINPGINVDTDWDGIYEVGF